MAILKLRKKKSVKPEQVSIQPRRMDFRFEAVPRHWAAGDPVLTHLFNALSLTFPDGERFFVDSVRAFRDRVTDPKRKQEISGFIGQEAMHSLEHNTFNEMLAAQGYADIAESGQQYARERIAGGQKYLSAKQQLAITAALEHITAILANGLLRDPELMESLDPSVRDLWLWHAIEETEHKAVAYDLYETVGADYRERVGLFLTATSALSVYAGAYTWQFLRADGIHRKPLTLLKGAWKLFGYKGFLTRLIPDYLDYLRPGFHPWDDDNSDLLERWRAVLERSVEQSKAA
jgi:predicted metal-dependent hydrolase